MNVLADASSIIGGSIANPLPYQSATSGGMILFFTNILRIVFVVAGIYAFINFILAGFSYMTAAGDAKQLTAAWAKIWQSLLGLAIIVSAFALASLASYIIFGKPDYILNPVIYGPNGPIN